MKTSKHLGFLALGTVSLAVLLGGLGSVQAADGFWELHRAELDPSIVDRDNVKRVTSTKSGSFVVQAQYFDREGKHVDNWTAAFRWGKLPRYLTVGNPLKLTIHHAITYLPKADVGSHVSIVGMRVQAPTSDGWVDRFMPGSADGRRGLEVHSRMPEKVNHQFSPIIEITAGGKDAELMGITVVVWHAGQSRWDWRYVYIWRSGEMPADAGEGIPSATEWDGNGPIPTTPDGGGSEGGQGSGGEGGQSGSGEAGQGGGESGQGGGGEGGGGGVGDLVDRNDIPATGMVLVADRRQVKAGGEVWLPIRLLRGRDIGNINFRAAYDSNLVRTAGDVSKGNVLGGALFSANPGQTGEVLIGFAANKGVSGDGTVAQIQFRAVGEPGSSSQIELSVSKINSSTGEELEIAAVDGRIDVLTADGRVLGDYNGNGKVDLADALAALKMSVKLIPEDLICDADSDGTVTSNDARILFQKVTQR